MKQASFIDVSPTRPRVFRFLWISKFGPRVRIFENIHTFSGYVAEVRQLCGFDVVEFRTPVLAVAVLP